MEKKETYLYVLLLPHMDKEYNLSYKVKFGYTENFESRMKTGYEAYYGNEGYQVLHVYKGYFTLDDEFAIKQYLQKYSLFKNEWFKCCQEVLGFFKTYDTPDKLKQKISEIPVMKKSEIKYHKVNYMLLDYLIQTYYNDLQDILEVQNKRAELETILREYTERNQYNYLKEELEFDLDAFNSYQENRLSNNSDDHVRKKVEEFNEIKAVRDRLRFLVEYSKTTTKENLENFLALIPGKYKDYYDTVGPEIITRYSYVESEIKKAWLEKVFNEEVKENVIAEILSIFVAGKRYTKKNIKKVLNDLYEKHGYKKKAKATDLKLYYDLKPILTSDKQQGFELISKNKHEDNGD
jgi:hypothetical protein